jgi:hypothetical protein
MLSPTRKFELFLTQLENKTWREVLSLVETEVYEIDPGLKTSFENPPRRGSYLSELLDFIYYCRYPTAMPECYKKVFHTMIDPPLVLQKKWGGFADVRLQLGRPSMRPGTSAQL